MAATRQPWSAKFANAFRGVRQGIQGQSSFLAHGAASLMVIATGWWLEVTRWEWCLLALCVGLVVVTEMLNSAVESLAAAITDEHDFRVGQALDIASGAVLLAGVTAAVVGGLIVWGHVS